MLPRIKSAAPHEYARVNPLPGPTRSVSHRDPVTQNTQHLEHNEFHRSRLPPCPIFLHFQSFVKGSRTRLILGGENGARRVFRYSVGAIEVRHDDMGLSFEEFSVCADDNPLLWSLALSATMLCAAEARLQTCRSDFHFVATHLTVQPGAG